VWQPRFFPAPLIRAQVLHWATGGATTPNFLSAAGGTLDASELD
jgi:hypothetical protein